MENKKVDLNKAQKKAVDYNIGPLLVVAGAGTGKTRVISQRIRSLIQSKNVDPKEILSLTFTEKAAGEMLNRIDDVMPLGYEEPWVSTFHSFADRLLRKEGLELGLDPYFRIITQPEQWILLRKNIFDFDLDYFRPLGNPTKFISAILKFVSRLQDENISSEDFRKFVNKGKSSESSEGDGNSESSGGSESSSDKFEDGLEEGGASERKRWLELADVYEKYEALKIENSVLDFGDLIIWLIKLFKKRPGILKKYQDQFKHVLVDEFQDTNKAQYELIKMLCPKDGLEKRSLLVVGDDSQSIYKFRGAAISNILEFRKDYPDTKMITLLKNYRSTQKILDSAYKVVKNNNPDTLESKLNISKELISQVSNLSQGPSSKSKTNKESKNKNPDPKVFSTDKTDDEVDLVVKKIMEILARESEYTYKDFAILARANNHLSPFVFALRKYGLPYQLVGNRGLYDRDEIVDIMSLIRVAVDPSDGLSLYRVLNIDSLEIDVDIISNLLSISRKKRTDLWNIVRKSSAPKVENLINIIRRFQYLITKRTPSEFVYEIVNYINYVDTYLQEETVENQLCIRNLDLFLSKAKSFEVNFKHDKNNMPTVIDFIDYIDLLIEAGDNPAQAEIQDINTINLLTVHSSKGLEFPVVFMVNVASGRFPTRNRSDMIKVPDEILEETLPVGDSHIQEERRLFYVGMTRAKKYLYISFAKSYGGVREKRPSGFLKETGLKIEHVTSDEIKVGGGQMGLFGVESGFRKPKAEKIKNFKPAFLSYSQVTTYQSCPLKYRYSYILNVPQPPSHNFSFGNAIHNTLKDFHSRQLFEDVSLDELLSFYDKNWEPFGYMSKEHREKRYESGKKILRKYYEDNKKLETKPLVFEKGFSIWIKGIKFYGRIDRIDKLTDGGVEVIDYKTGETKDQSFVDKDDQVTFYAIGVKEALGFDPKKLTLYYVESGKKISTTRTDKELEDKKEDVGDVVEDIKNGKFEAKPGWQCKWCSYNNLCPFAKEGMR